MSGDLQPFECGDGTEALRAKVKELKSENEFLNTKIASTQQSIQSFHGEQKLL